MKTRNGFVSNSSSSSFVIAVKDDAKVQITVEVDLENFGTTIETIEELDAYILDRYGYSGKSIDELCSECEYTERIYDASKKEIEAGKKVIHGSFSDDSYDNPLEAYLCHNGLKGIVDTDKIEVIDSEGGY